ncbi:hypothetical protein [Pseudomonas sp. GD03944]|nr:hypothetical protein [Pseudomonas sp. GD03944]MDH1264744.1 hypothetical protein [Pseudomonas sp. GD03944]
MPRISLAVQCMNRDAATGSGGCVLPVQASVVTGESANMLVQASQD